MITLGLLGVFISGLIVMIVGLINAPEGYQADGEFHVLWRNNSPDVSNIVCIWSGQTVVQEVSQPRELAA